MVSERDLLNLLQFVALALPAIAILMQVVVSISEDEGKPPGFGGIEISLHIVLVGGALIGYELIQRMESTIIQLATVLILLSFPLLALSLAYSIRPDFHQSAFMRMYGFITNIDLSKRFLNNIKESLTTDTIIRRLYALIMLFIIEFIIVAIPIFVIMTITWWGLVLPLDYPISFKQWVLVAITLTIVSWSQSHGFIISVEEDVRN